MLNFILMIEGVKKLEFYNLKQIMEKFYFIYYYNQYWENDFLYDLYYNQLIKNNNIYFVKNKLKEIKKYKHITRQLFIINQYKHIIDYIQYHFQTISYYKNAGVDTYKLYYSYKIFTENLTNVYEKYNNWYLMTISNDDDIDFIKYITDEIINIWDNLINIQSTNLSEGKQIEYIKYITNRLNNINDKITKWLMIKIEYQLH